MRDVRCMRTTLNLDDDVLAAVKELAALRGSTAGAVLSELARTAILAGPATSAPTRNGVPLLTPTADARLVTPDVVDSLRDHD